MQHMILILALLLILGMVPAFGEPHDTRRLCLLSLAGVLKIEESLPAIDDTKYALLAHSIRADVLGCLFSYGTTPKAPEQQSYLHVLATDNGVLAVKLQPVGGTALRVDGWLTTIKALP